MKNIAVKACTALIYGCFMLLLVHGKGLPGVLYGLPFEAVCLAVSRLFAKKGALSWLMAAGASLGIIAAFCAWPSAHDALSLTATILVMILNAGTVLTVDGLIPERKQQ